MSLLIVVGLAGVLVQSPPSAPSAAISGSIVEEGSRTPIPGAEVTLIPSRSRPRGPFIDRPRTAVTDHDGRYEFDRLEAGRYRLMVQKAGFAALDGPEVPDLALKSGERRDGVTMTLQRGAAIVGRVLDENGEPLVNAPVMATQRLAARTGFSGPEMQVPVGPAVQTNDLGEFRLFSLRPGEYHVLAMPGFNPGRSQASRGTTMLPTYFPGTADRASAQSISVGTGQTAGDVVIRMISTPAFQVSGVVTDEAGRPIANAMVRVMPDDPQAVPIFMMGRSYPERTDSAGRFTINGVTNGTYTLLAAAPMVISGPSNQRGVVTGGSNGSFAWHSSGVVGGTVGGGVITETSNGATIQYRDDTATRVPITINQASVSAVEVIVKRPGR